MKISSKATFAASLMLGTMLLIAVSIGWANAQVRAAVAQRGQSIEIVDALNNMRMVSFEYLLNRRNRSRLQEQIVWERLERLFANPVPLDKAATSMLANLRSQGEASHRLFSEVDATTGTVGADDDVQRRFEAQLSSRILILQQNSLVDAEQLVDQAAHPLACRANALKAVAGVVVKPVAIVLQEREREAIHASQRAAQVVGDRIAE